MPHTMVLFVHLQYDPPDSLQSQALRALAATVVRTATPPLYLVGGYAYDDFDTDSLPKEMSQAHAGTLARHEGKAGATV